MRWIDRYAYTNRLHRLDPAYKAGFSLGALLLCLIYDRPLVSGGIVILFVILSILWAALPAGFVVRLITAEASFLLVGVLGVAVNVHLDPVGTGLALGNVHFSFSSGSIDLAVRILLRALGCAAAMNFLAATTPLVDLIDLMRRLRVPDLLIDLMILIYRFIFASLDSLERMVIAHEARLGFSGWRNALHSSADIGARLFIETFRRTQLLDTALQGRCWDGTLRVLPQEYETLKWPWLP